MYEVEVEPIARRAIRQLPLTVRSQILAEIENLGTEPRPRGMRKLKDTNLWRIRIGQYRVVYEIDNRQRRVIIAKVSHRNEGTYRRLS